MKNEDTDSNEKKKENEKAPDFEITELFLVRAGRNNYNQTFIGEIRRQTDSEGKEISVCGSVNIDGDGCIWSRESNLDDLGQNLDDMTDLRIFHGLHNEPGPRSVCAKNFIYLN